MSAKQEWTQLAAQLRAEGKTQAEIAQALRNHARREQFDLSPLTALRLAHGSTQHDAAREWTKRWPNLPKTYKDFSNWETGRHTPRLDIFDKLAQLYSCDLADLLADRPGYRLRDPMASVEHRTARSSASVAHNTRELDRLPGDQAVVADPMAEDAKPFDVALSALAGRGVTRVGPRQVGAHQEMEEALAGLYRSADPLAVLPATKAYADSVLEQLDRPMGEKARAELGAVAAGVHAQVGLWACHMHRPHLAYRYLSTACDLATATGDRGLRARTLGALSYLFSSAPRGGSGGRPDHALRLLDHALELAQNSDSFTTGWLATWRADQYATLGNLGAARADVDAADAWLSATDHGGPRGFFARSSYGYAMASHLDSVRGLVFALGGQADEADRAFEHVQATSPNARRWIATQEHRGLGDVKAGNPAQACTALGIAVALAVSENYGMGLMRAFGVRRRFDPGWSSMTCVRDLDEQLHVALPHR